MGAQHAQTQSCAPVSSARRSLVSRASSWRVAGWGGGGREGVTEGGQVCVQSHAPRARGPQCVHTPAARCREARPRGCRPQRGWAGGRRRDPVGGAHAPAESASCWPLSARGAAATTPLRRLPRAPPPPLTLATLSTGVVAPAPCGGAGMRVLPPPAHAAPSFHGLSALVSLSARGSLDDGLPVGNSNAAVPAIAPAVCAQPSVSLRLAGSRALQTPPRAANGCGRGVVVGVGERGNVLAS